jgi:hypothetical protein
VTALRAPLVAVALSAAACFPAASGPPFHAVAAPKDMALVYIYRPDEERGRVVRYHVTGKQGPIVWLIRGGYYAHLARPGETEFWADTNEHASVTEQLVAGKTYYLKGTVEQGAWFGRPELVFESAETARREIEQCVLLPPAVAKSGP